MEITPEIKAKVFAQYLGQKTSNGNDTLSLIGLYNIVYGSHKFIPIKLLLRPLSAITDEDKLYCYHRHSEHCRYDETQSFAPLLDMANHLIEKEGIKSLYFLSTQFQYLQSKGYDLPSIHLSGKNLHEAGLAIYKD